MSANLITYMKIKQKYNNTINGDLRGIQYMLVHIGIIYYIIQFESFCCPPWVTAYISKSLHKVINTARYTYINKSINKYIWRLTAMFLSDKE